MLQRVLLIGSQGGRLSPNVIENKRAEIQQQSGATLASEGIVIGAEEWPGILDDLKTLASGEDKSFTKTSEAIKFVLAQRGDPRGGGGAEEAEGGAPPEAEGEAPSEAEVKAAPEAEGAGEKGEDEKKDNDEEEEEDLEPWRKFAEKKTTAPAAAAANEPVFEYFHDKHGADKHFNKSLSKGAQWDKSAFPFKEADALMKRAVTDNLSKLLAHTPEGKVKIFYFSADHGSVVGAVKGTGDTTCYTMQIDVDRKNNTITYHGYPEQSPTLGLGATVRTKGTL
jgi:hypothetical protein